MTNRGAGRPGLNALPTENPPTLAPLLLSVLLQALQTRPLGPGCQLKALLRV